MAYTLDGFQVGRNTRRGEPLPPGEAPPRERVLSFMPIYIFPSHAEPVPGYENDEAPVAAQIGGMSGADAARLKLITNGRLKALIRSDGVRLIVAPGNSRFVWGSAGRPWDVIVREAGYRPLGTFDRVTIWIRPEDAAKRGSGSPAVNRRRRARSRT